MNGPANRLKRSLNPMPDYIYEALLQGSWMERFRNRPAYQQNDYIGWIGRGKQKETRDRRLAQMLAELESGDKYMNMDYRP